MKFSKTIMTIVIFITMSSCSKKNLNLPEASAMPPRNQAPKSDIQPIEVSKCAIQFYKNMNYEDVAVLAHDMHTVCGLTEEQIVNLAQKSFN